MTKSNRDSISRKALAVTTVFAIATAIFGAYISLPEEAGMGTLTVSAAPNDPGTGASGFLEVFIVDHDSGPYTSNISEGDANVIGYANSDSFSIDIPHSTAFDIVVWTRANTSDANDGSWNTSLIRCNMTATDLGITTLTSMSEEQIGTNSTYIWVNYYLDNGGSGYTINRDETANIDEILYEHYG